jgi:glycosyltransferase involved in cell wall biosynthesis
MRSLSANRSDDKPLISVIVPAFNVERYLADALESVLQQTYPNLEVIVVDDASTDRSRDIAERFRLTDSRVRVFDHAENRGLAAARNTGIENAKGAYLALLDGDDVAGPTRLSHQMDAMLRDSALGMVGSHVAIIDEAGRFTGRIWRRPTDPDRAGIGLIFRNTFSAVVLMRREAVPEGGYRRPMAEDYDFNVRLAAKWKVVNVDEALTFVRVRQSGLTATRPQLMVSCIRDVMGDQLAAIGVNASPREIDLNLHVGDRGMRASRKLLDDIDAWLGRLTVANQRCHRFDGRAFAEILGEEWFEVCLAATELGMPVVSRYRQSKLSRAWTPSLRAWFRFLVKAGLRHQRVDRDRVQAAGKP